MTTFRNLVAGSAVLALGVAAGFGLAVRMSAGGGRAVAPAAPAPAAAASAERKVLYWYDPMVPTQKFDKPGKSPFMDMALVPRYADEGDAVGGVSVSPQAVQSLGLRVAKAERRSLRPSVDVPGTVALNEREVTVVQARAAGFVERVYARAPGDLIAAGAPIADLMHPEWLAAQQEFLAVRGTGDATLAAAARQRLTLLGMPAALVAEVEHNGRPQAVVTVTSPAAGLLAELMVRQGMTVGAGMTLARVVGLDTVWVDAAVPQALAAGIAPGLPATVRPSTEPGREIRGRVTALLAEANADSRTLRVRIELPNPGGRLRAGLFAQVALHTGSAGPEVAVPAEAVIRTGRRALVYRVEGPGRYQPQEVDIGAEVDGWIAIRKGLAAGDAVVASAQFLIDSEASLQGVPARGTAAAAAEHETTGTVTEIDGGSITIDHAPVAALKWPAMTMPFALARPELTRGLKPGDAVKLRFRQQGADSTLTAIERLAGAPPAPAAAPVAADPHAGHRAASGGAK